MKDLLRTARLVQDFLDQQGWRSCIIGGLAVLRWGEPRLTVDVDVTLLTGWGHEEPFVDVLLRRFQSRLSNPREFALRHRVMLLHADDGTSIDLALGGLPFEERAVNRASDFPFLADVSLRTCSAEDLVIMKAFAARDQDWVDLKGILVRQAGRLDWPLIYSELEPLCAAKEAPDILERLQQLRLTCEA